jgi:hypothetical protein
MRTISILLFSIILIFTIFSCSGQRALSKENPEAGASARIVLNNGKIVEGLLLVIEGDNLKYIDTKSHRPETLLLSNVKEVTRSQYIYDLEGNTSTEADIKNAKTSSKTITYAAGGTALGAVVGVGIGLVLVHNYDVPVIYPLATMGIVGGIIFGLQGNSAAYNDAIETVRENRYQKMQMKMRNELDSEKKRLEKERDEEEKKLKELKKQN